MYWLILAASLSANDINISYENFTFERGIARITMKITNSGSHFVKSSFINCAFQDGKKRVIDIGPARVTNLEPGAYKYEQASIVTDRDVQHAECYVDNVR